MIRIKICGITNLEDAQAAVDEGADAIGFIFYPKSPRVISYRQAGEIVRALPPFVSAVGVFVNESADKIREAAKVASLSHVQLHGEESPLFCENLGLSVIKAFRISVPEDLDPIKNFAVRGILLDSYQRGEFGGTGIPFDWKMLNRFSSSKPVILSGGLNPDNIREAIEQYTPNAVDVSSGVEKSPGIKEREKMKRFIQLARGIR
ncbi:MAG: phosphoribosylanthranilate isomerase [Nitrospirae bacterium]|nr:phosphoribosylanthranilate isomerase [Nitrospirota bacterium]MBI3595182.1 phosphoribosylanthranilate isomerase [Nitrospirota bacterium]